jgi:GDSL-like Lipase/Acylhydrolase family
MKRFFYFTFLFGAILASCVIPGVETQRDNSVKKTCPPRPNLDPNFGTTPDPTTPGTPMPGTPMPVVPAPMPTPDLVAPKLSPQAGTYLFGTPIEVQTESLPKDAYAEYSLDGGKTWANGSKFQLTCSATICVRVRLADKASPTTCATYKVAFKRAVFVGNSITLHAPAPEIGWKGNWGMAATAADKDYRSLLMAQLNQRRNNTESIIFRAVPFEQQYWNYDLANLQEITAKSPDLIIIRIGENVDEGKIWLYKFEQYYHELVKLAVKYEGAKVICVGSFWNQPDVNRVMKAQADYFGVDWVKIDDLLADPSNTAKGLYSDPGVALHPSDKGMKAISDRIWKVIE